MFKLVTGLLTLLLLIAWVYCALGPATEPSKLVAMLCLIGCILCGLCFNESARG